MATEPSVISRPAIPDREVLDPKIYDGDQLFKGYKIYVDGEGLEGKDRRFFSTTGAVVYSEGFVKNAKGTAWVGQGSGSPTTAQRLIQTKRGNWIMNEYSLAPSNTPGK